MSEPLKSTDPAAWMLSRGIQEEFAIANGADIPEDERWVTKTTVYNDRCFICKDPEFALMGLPLCKPCEDCGAHVPADDTVCDNGHDTYEIYMRGQ